MPHVRIRRDDNEKNGILVNDGEMKEKGGEIQVNILSSKSWTKVKQWTKKAWAGYRQKGEVGRDENWEVRKLQRVLYPMTRGGGGGRGVQFHATDTTKSSPAPVLKDRLSWDGCSTNVVLDLFQSLNLDLCYR